MTTNNQNNVVGNAAALTGNASSAPAQIVPVANNNVPNQMGVADLGGQLVTDPQTLINNQTSLGANTPMMTGNEAGTNQSSTPAQYQPGAIQGQAQQVGQTAQAGQQTNPGAQGYQSQGTYDQVAQNGMTGAQGQVSNGAIINAPQVDMQGAGTGVNQDGTTNQLGQALNQAATQNMSQIIDTSTVSGKLLAQALGEGNYVDSKATMTGQLEILSKEFIDPTTGEPKIPSWAAATARSVSRIAAFKGMTGSAATAALSQAIMEASLPIAQQDAQFFQTLTLKNLDNRQQSTLNKANVLAKLEQANLDARMTAAVENSKSFLQMDLANLNNEQQARVINTQSRVQSILEDAKAENTARMFSAESANDMNKFYDNLNASIQMYNAGQTNQMSQFNVGQTNAMEQFNKQLEVSREQFYRNMQYNIDQSNANWRRQVTLQNNANQFEAAATDVKNMVGLSVEQLNRLWDRSDSLLDYAWKSTESELDRKQQLAAIQLQGQFAQSAADAEGAGSIWGSVLGAIVGGIF